MRALTALLILMISIQTANAQATPDTIEIRRDAIYVYKEKIIATDHLMYILKSDPEADEEMTIAINNLTYSRVFGYTGGFIIGYSAVRFLMRGGGPYVRLGIAGALVSVVSIPFSRAYKTHSKKAVLIYNDGLKNPPVSSNEHNRDYRIGVGPTSDGIGIIVSF